jgi:DNA polymerase III subunit gamma/tau
MAWYNKYRPQQFMDVIGQNLVKSVLQNSILQNKIKHGYLLSGPKGTGKTTLARIFANEINQISDNPQAKIDIIELDAASNTGVDNIRQLIDSAQVPPFSGKYKIYIIDEVHMLSKSAMNALLKILEEPPTYLIFLLATTNPEKLLPTVLSRLTKLNLTSHSIKDIVSLLTHISTQENMNIDNESLNLIATRAGGGQRDAINLLETLYSYNLDKYSILETTKLLGLLHTESLYNLSFSLINQLPNIQNNLMQIEELGLDGESFLGQWLDYLLNLSFAGQSDFDSLIIPIAEILNLKLPINTVSSSLALVQVKFRYLNNIQSNSQVNNSDKKKIIPDKKSQIEELKDFKKIQIEQKLESKLIEQPTIDKKIEQSDLENDSINVVLDTSRTEVIEVDLVNQIERVEKNLEHQSESDFILSTSFIRSISNQADCPSILKMIASDIELESHQEENIVVSVSSPMFLPQLSQPKNKAYLTSFLNKKMQTVVIEIIKRDGGNKPKIIFNHNTENLEGIRQEQKNDIKSNQIESKSLNLHTQSSLEQINNFYYVFKGLPKDTVGDTSKIKIWDKPIDPPPKIKIESVSEIPISRDEHLESMFDFE